MKRLLSFLWSGCWHEWEVIKETRLEWSDDFGGHGTCTRFIMQCKKCGTLKKYDAQ